MNTYPPQDKPNQLPELHFFDRTQDYCVIERRLPHWTQPGVVCFITFRTNDSMPKEVLQRWRSEREDWLRKHGINPRRPRLETAIDATLSRRTNRILSHVFDQMAGRTRLLSRCLRTARPEII